MVMDYSIKIGGEVFRKNALGARWCKLMANSISKSSVHFVECAAPLLTVLIVLLRRGSLFSSCTS